MQKAGIAMHHWPIDFHKIGHILMIVMALYVGSAVCNVYQAGHHELHVATHCIQHAETVET